MTRTCRDCNDTGLVATETGDRSYSAPFAPTMTTRPCSCSIGRDLTKPHFGPHIPEAEIADRLIEAEEKRMRESGMVRCRGDYWCGAWVEAGSGMCDECKRDRGHD